jgi:hypothetical protein
MKYIDNNRMMAPIQPDDSMNHTNRLLGASASPWCPAPAAGCTAASCAGPSWANANDKNGADNDSSTLANASVSQNRVPHNKDRNIMKTPQKKVCIRICGSNISAGGVDRAQLTTTVKQAQGGSTIEPARTNPGQRRRTTKERETQGKRFRPKLVAWLAVQNLADRPLRFTKNQICIRVCRDCGVSTCKAEEIAPQCTRTCGDKLAA